MARKKKRRTNKRRQLAQKRKGQTPRPRTAMKRLRRRSKCRPDLSLVSSLKHLQIHQLLLICPILSFLAELDRLTTVVHAIENDCQICPVGSFKMTPEHQVRRNEAFRGLEREGGMRLDSYLHFRNV